MLKVECKFNGPEDHERLGPGSIDFFVDGGDLFSFDFHISTCSMFTDYSPEKWRNVASGKTVSDVFVFGDVYGSHVDSGTVEIHVAAQSVYFTVDGAKGGKIQFQLKREHCRAAFYDVALALEESY